MFSPASWLRFFGASLAAASFFLTQSALAAVPFVKLENCRLIPNESNDGDSFHVSAGGKESIFRLYFVDTPETEARFPERVAEQGAYFGIKPDQALRVGKIAQSFTRGKLAGKRFTVYTRWQDARGESRLNRYYGIVVVEDKPLSELLVANGLARVFGAPAVLPDGTSAKAFEQRLRKLEEKAKQQHLGAWSIGAAKTPASQSPASWESMFKKPGGAPQPAPAPSLN